MIDISALRALVAVELHGSVVAASDVMGFSPSAVSQQIKKLEKQTGVIVLERNGRGVLLTERGLALAGYGRRIMGELEELQATLLADPSKPSGLLRLVAFSTACRGLVGPMLGRMSSEHPALNVTVLAEDPREAVQRVATGEAELAVVHNWNSVPLVIPENLVLEDLCIDQADVLLNSTHPLSGRASVEREDLLEETWISTPAGAICNEALLQIFAGLGKVPDIRIYDPDFSTHIAMVEQGVAVALVPRLGRPPLPGNVVAIPVINPVQQRSVGVVYRKTMTASPNIRMAVGMLREISGGLALPSG
ncbi:LysR family transcriptional regulator [Paenarthrobacter aurescens]|uniref:LysR family transcriptional regulator n=1 Tax=Paenarthrobacter aurescens TaxID=43663 RepID=A0A4Y3NF00_PAEAU|nr:LysR family transcriptional regulator [Paenarthrobacter aurescens]MDO6142407.1 LysR family transcriptional regulator [Paenarthrobacter aurescens]MDO6146254.1 LysR family transcriptional regulator [Paenarthrobacter aurescens]MDO6157499.1 LysR family transcriptional regulator [Paenarthrobacter aurescens]MDO6161484.1 LysR family transcriptional regulator [Paenarthrobacter aurescens]GEB20594.1 LysR family transcriptional regulator [Paenarthrobacter aurescens]